MFSIYHTANLMSHLVILLWLLPALIIKVHAEKNLGALTTPFTIPSSCTSAFLPCELCTVAVQAQTCGTKHWEDDSNCWPLRPPQTEPAGFVNGFYSPGDSCPVGYTSACEATSGGDASSSFTFDFAPNPSEIAIGCCPSNFACTNVPSGELCGAVGCDKTSTGNTLIQKCVSTAQATDYKGFVCFGGQVTPITLTVPAVGTIHPSMTAWVETLETMTFTVANSIETVTTSVKEKHTVEGRITVFVPSISVFAPLIQLVHQRTGKPGSSESTAGSEQQKEHHSSLSTGAKAGIGIGAAARGLALVGGLFFFFSRWRQNKRALKLAKGDSYVANLENYELNKR